MCFDLDSRPPIAPIAGGSLDSAELVLTAADANRLRAFRARAEAPTGAGIVILPDVRGLHPYYVELALRFAEHGVDAVAIDYFGRTAGIEPRPADFDHRAHVAELTWTGEIDDIRAGVEFLRSPDAGAPRSVFTIGFCMGGRLAFLASTLGLGLAGAIGFYGWPTVERQGGPAPSAVARDLANPVLGIFGGADQGIGPDAVDEFERALTEAGVEHRLITYPGAPHGFFDQKAEQFEVASRLAWDETLGFIRSHTGGAAG